MRLGLAVCHKESIWRGQSYAVTDVMLELSDFDLLIL